MLSPRSYAISFSFAATFLSACIGEKDGIWPIDTGIGSSGELLRGKYDCGSWSDATGAELGYGNYPDSSASSGPECLCDFSVSAGGSYYVSAVAVSGSGTEPKAIAAASPWHSKASSRNPSTAGSGFSATYPALSSSSSAVSVAGTYSIWYAAVDAAGGAVSACSAYETPTWSWSTSAPEGPPPPVVEDSGTAEDGLACTPGATVRERFALRVWPGWDSLAPLALGGTRFGGAELRAIRVVDWGDADSLSFVGADGVAQTLSPWRSTLSLPAESAWFGSAQLYADKLSGVLPTVELSGVCPVRSAEPVVRAPGYSLTLDRLIPGAPASRLVARVVPDGGDVGPVTHHLMLELEGTDLATGVPLVQVAPEVWSLDTAGERFSATGTVTRSQAGLTLDLDEAWIDGLGQLSEMSWSATPYSR